MVAVSQLSVFNCRLEIIYVNVLLKIVGNSTSNVQITYIFNDLLRY